MTISQRSVLKVLTCFLFTQRFSSGVILSVRHPLRRANRMARATESFESELLWHLLDAAARGVPVSSLRLGTARWTELLCAKMAGADTPDPGWGTFATPSADKAKILLGRLRKNLSVACPGDAQIFLGFRKVGMKT